MVIVFLGAPGSGKGTQAALLAEKRNLIHLSTGDLLREARSSGSSLGALAASYMDRGELVPDRLVSGLVEERIADSSEDFLLDGYPRNLAQADDLDRIVASAGQTLTAVVLLDVPEDELVLRLSGRGRSDDAPVTIRQRLSVYSAQTAPLVARYASEGILYRVNGLGAIEEIHTRVIDVIS